jgi:hypothetical protein
MVQEGAGIGGYLFDENDGCELCGIDEESGRCGIVPWFANNCQNERHALLHRDRDFEPFEKYLALRVIHP